MDSNDITGSFLTLGVETPLEGNNAPTEVTLPNSHIVHTYVGTYINVVTYAHT